MYFTISFRLSSKSYGGNSLIWFLSFYHLLRLSKCIASSVNFSASFKSSRPRLLSELPHPPAGQTSRSFSGPWSSEVITLYLTLTLKGTTQTASKSLLFYSKLSRGMITEISAEALVPDHRRM
ncbi:hypothetical protein AMECASPLE_016336 [Ameca splendens]|uniref:Uncharacterized protein n=1 Tax=Ameca splendens TaxID=208324 RepID=A0ABV0ZXX9_9TELE